MRWLAALSKGGTGFENHEMHQYTRCRYYRRYDLDVRISSRSLIDLIRTDWEVSGPANRLTVKREEYETEAQCPFFK